MNSLLDQLHDIEGLDPISFWPLAIGWWIIIAWTTLFLFLGIGWIIYKIRFLRSWKGDSHRKLAQLEKDLTVHSARDSVITLSEYLRRIVLKNHSRAECAGLVGEDWLNWLQENDSKKFDWKTRGKLLIQVPYAPLNCTPSVDEIKDLIQAVRHWVH